MVGINIKSGKVYNREKDAEKEARDLIAYCKCLGYNVKYWYIGNECYKGWSASGYADYIDRYAEILKSVDPDITIIGDWKFGPAEKNRFEETIQIALESEHIDIIEMHEKWGNEWGLASGMTLDDWRNEFPIYNGEIDSLIDLFHVRMEQAGRDVRLGFNEWGIGGLQGGNENFVALVAADMMIEFFRNDIHQACYWNLNMGGGITRVLNTTEDRTKLLNFNPISHVFELYAHALEKELAEIASSKKHIYGFAARDSTAGGIHLYLLNKSDIAATVNPDIRGYYPGNEMQRQTLTPDGKLNAITGPDESLILTLPPWSFSRIFLPVE
jgi:hypothetical protein